MLLLITSLLSNHFSEDRGIYHASCGWQAVRHYTGPDWINLRQQLCRQYLLMLSPHSEENVVNCDCDREDDEGAYNGTLWSPSP